MKHRTDDDLLALLRDVDVPEPSPLFWDHLSQRVREAVANEPPPAPGWMNRLNVAWAAGVFGAVAVVVLAVNLHRGAPQPVSSAPPPVGADVARAGRSRP